MKTVDFDDIKKFFSVLFTLVFSLSVIIPFTTIFIALIESAISQDDFGTAYVHRLKSFIALVVFAILHVSSLAVLYCLTILILKLAEKINQVRLRAFSYKQPTLFNELLKRVSDDDSLIGLFLFGNWLIGIISYFLFDFGAADPFIYITIIQTLLLLGFYVEILYDHKHFGRWIFYQVRAYIFPYLLFLFPLFVGGMLAIFSQYWLLIRVFNFFDIPVIELIEGYPILDKLPPWNEALDVMINCLLWSFGICLILVWIIPIFLRKDYLSIIVIILALLAPVITNIIVDSVKPINVFLTNFSKVPAPVSSLLLVLFVDKSYNFLQSLITPGTSCPKCGNSISLSDNYCNVCGNQTERH